MDNNNVPINRHGVERSEVQNDRVNNKCEIKINDFASGFPDWDLTPPAVVVKRVRRRI